MDGTITFQLTLWSRFADLLDAEIFQTPAGLKSNYIWRGQRDVAWSLSSSLDRLFGKLGLLGAGPSVLEARSRQHLEAFK